MSVKYFFQSLGLLILLTIGQGASAKITDEKPLKLSVIKYDEKIVSLKAQDGTRYEVDRKTLATAQKLIPGTTVLEIHKKNLRLVK